MFNNFPKNIFVKAGKEVEQVLGKGHSVNRKYCQSNEVNSEMHQFHENISFPIFFVKPEKEIEQVFGKACSVTMYSRGFCQIIEVNSAMHQFSRKLFVVAEKEIELAQAKSTL